ncbi:CID domain-containing protein [Caerostris extrusa]|uniref:CID domain-containing protein n=1 Tax=Caerostris extrusa TaxID=172846 RepID=A0AAV4TLP3_CAEEX|nr:CID domain-containing protein [Caerostris extrusa]
MAVELNIEDLQKKIASVTKSKKSIEALSSWMIHHKEFYKEISGQWFISLSKNLNVLPMFYVVNDVLFYCAKRKIPEYREEFSKILEKAVCLQKVKDLKSDVHRLLKMWTDRGIYSEGFYNRILNKLNIAELKPLSEEVDDVIEREIIKEYKNLNKLKAVESKAKEKEEIVKLSKEPPISELKILIVKNELEEALEKLDSHIENLRDSIQTKEGGKDCKKNVVKELEVSSVNYTSELIDAKITAEAYSSYEKKVNVVKETLSEMMTAFSSPVCGDPGFDRNASSVSKSSSKIPSSSISGHLKPGISFPGKILKELTSDKFKNIEETSYESEDYLCRQKFSKLTDLYAKQKCGYDHHTACTSRQLSEINFDEKSTLSSSSQISDLLIDDLDYQNINTVELENPSHMIKK